MNVCRKIFLIFLGIVLFLSIVGSQRRNGGRFNFRGRLRQNAESPTTEATAITESEPPQPISEAVEKEPLIRLPKRPSRRRRPVGARQARPLPAIEGPPADKESEVEAETPILKDEDAKEDNRPRGLRIRIPKRPQTKPNKAPVISELPPENIKDDPIKEGNEDQNLKIPHDQDLILKPEPVEINAKVVESKPRRPKFRPIPLKVHNKVNNKSTKEAKTEVATENDELAVVGSPLEPKPVEARQRFPHRFQGGRRPPLILPHSRTPRVELAPAQTEEPEEMAKKPFAPPAVPRRRPQTIFNFKRPSLKKEGIAEPTREEIQDQPVQVVQEEEVPVSLFDDPEMLSDKRLGLHTFGLRIRG